MSKRLTPQLRAWVYHYLVATMGEYCILCGKSNCKLQIDHIDANPHNNERDNLCLLCPTCNKKLQRLTPQEHKKLIKLRCDQHACMRERERGNPATSIVKETIDYTNGTVQMQANQCFEVEFREWLLKQIKAIGYYLKDDAVYSGAEVVGCSPETIVRYIRKLTSSEGVLEEVMSNNKQRIIKYKNGHNGNGHYPDPLNVDQLIMQVMARKSVKAGKGGNGHET